LPAFTGAATTFAFFFEVAGEGFAAGLAGLLAAVLRVAPTDDAFVRDEADDFDFATTFLDFEAALAMA